jgi:FKBP-type peptidyl-prolyl cis-trans isomerase 2
MLPGIAAVIMGMEVGATKSGELAPGELVPPKKAAATRVPLGEFPDGADPKVGDRFQAKDASGADVMFEVFERDEDAVRIWPLHPLHDRRLGYEVKVVSARRPELPPPTPGRSSFPTLEVELIEE